MSGSPAGMRRPAGPRGCASRPVAGSLVLLASLLVLGTGPGRSQDLPPPAPFPGSGTALPDVAGPDPSESGGDAGTPGTPGTPDEGVAPGPDDAGGAAPDTFDPETEGLHACAEFEQQRVQLSAETRRKRAPVENLINVGGRALRNRFFDEAKQALETAVDVTRDLEERWHAVAGNLLQSVGTSAKFTRECTQIVSKSLSEAIDLRTVLHRIYPLLGEAYFELGNFEQAAAELRKSTRIRPEDPRSWRALGRALLRGGQYADSVDAFDESVRLDGYQPQTYYELAVAHAKRNDVRRAVFYLKRSISKGFNRFEQIEEDDDFANLRGDPEFETMVYHGPGIPY